MLLANRRTLAEVGRGCWHLLLAKQATWQGPRGPMWGKKSPELQQSLSVLPLAPFPMGRWQGVNRASSGGGVAGEGREGALGWALSAWRGCLHSWAGSDKEQDSPCPAAAEGPHPLQKVASGGCRRRLGGSLDDASLSRLPSGRSLKRALPAGIGPRRRSCWPEVPAFISISFFIFIVLHYYFTGIYMATPSFPVTPGQGSPATRERERWKEYLGG